MKIIMRIMFVILLLVIGFAAGFPFGKSIGFSVGSEWALVQAEIFAREAGVFMPVYYEEGQFRIIIKQPRNIYKRAWRLADIYHKEVESVKRGETETAAVAHMTQLDEKTVDGHSEQGGTENVKKDESASSDGAPWEHVENRAAPIMSLDEESTSKGTSLEM
jgi:hypothetical protein